jgi:beta-glucosidase/6-phospho-beta-glucosidase/beta-galactosidase
MRQRLGSDLPTFSEKDKKFIKNKIDFIGLNHYTSRLIAHHQNPDDVYFYKVQQMERVGMIFSYEGKITNVLFRHQMRSRVFPFTRRMDGW